MNIRKIERRLPEGFRVRRSGGKICIYAARRESVILDLAGEGETARRAVRRLRGRGRPSVVETGGERLVVRHYYHGGIFRGLTGDLFPGTGRFLNELLLLERARRAGVAVPEPAGLLIEPAAFSLFRADLVTVYLPESVDLLSHCRNLFSSGFGRCPAGIISAAGGQVARLHRAGILHGDLQLKNFLVLPGRTPPEVLLLDFDRARKGPVSPAGRRRNLRRLYRSFLKLKLSRPGVSRYDPVRFLRAYAPGEREFRRRVIARFRRRRAANWLHRAKWKLSLSLRGSYYARPMKAENGGEEGDKHFSVPSRET